MWFEKQQPVEPTPNNITQVIPEFQVKHVMWAIQYNFCCWKSKFGAVETVDLEMTGYFWGKELERLVKLTCYLTLDMQ